MTESTDKVTFTQTTTNHNSPSYPTNSKIVFEFDSYDLNVCAYVEQFACFLKSITFSHECVIKGFDNWLGEHDPNYEERL